MPPLKKLDEAQWLLSQQQFSQALKAAQAALRKDPRSALAANIAGVSLGATGRHQEAVTQFRKAVHLAPRFDEARRNLAQAHIALGQADKAEPILVDLIQTAPGDDRAWYLLAQCQMILGQLDLAENSITNVISMSSSAARALLLRAGIRDRAGRIKDAIADFQSVLRTDPDNIDALVGIALPLARQTRFDEALTAIRRAVELAPDHSQARLRLAVTLVAAGDREGALAALKELLDRVPGHPDALEQIVTLQGPGANDALRPMIAATKTAVPRKSEAYASLCFSEAIILEQAHDDPGAIRARAEANRAMSHLLPYDPQGDQRLTDRILKRFPPHSNEADTSAPANPRPIYVLGLPRSGTTLAEAILGAHPAVAALGERAAAGALLSGVINQDLPFDGEAVNRFNEADRRLLPELPPDAVAYVDKMPENYRLIGFLLTAQPQCRIIHVRRDPRDVALSMWRGHFQGTALNYTYDLKAMAHRFNLFARMMTHWNAVFPERILEIRYEDMVLNVEATGRRMADFCGLDWHPNMTAPQEHAGQVLTLSALQLRQPVHARSVGKWRAHAEELAPFITGLEPNLWPDLS